MSVSLIFCKKESDKVKEYLLGIGIGLLLINFIYANVILWERKEYER